MKVFFVVCTVVISFSTVQAFADSFRCPNGNIVSTGDGISTAAAKCDAPASIFKREEPIETEVSKEDGTIVMKTIYVEVQEWAYTKDSNLLHTLIFRNGILKEVITGGFIR